MKISWHYRFARVAVPLAGWLAVFLVYVVSATRAYAGSQIDSTAQLVVGVFGALGMVMLILLWGFLWSPNKYGDEPKSAVKEVPPPVRHDGFCPHCGKPIAIVQAVAGASPLVLFKPEQEGSHQVKRSG